MFDTLKIVGDDKIPGLATLLAPFAHVRLLPTKSFSADTIGDANVLFVRTPIRCNAQLLENSPVSYIGTASIGYDHIDRTYCTEKGIVWSNAPGCNKGSVLSYLLAAVSTIALMQGRSLSSYTIGIVGVGNVGREIERACRAIGMRVLLNDPPRQEHESSGAYVSLSEIASQCDVITFHTPLTRKGKHPSYHLADASFFNQLERKPIIINAARGGVVDESALIDAFDNGKIEALAIDCWEGEPHANPDVMQRCALATPHIAGFSRDGKFNGTRMSVDAMAKHFGLTIDTSLISPPPPANPLIDCIAFQRDILCEAILHTYPIEQESRQLKELPDKFVAQRDHYPLRRDFRGYTLLNAPRELYEVFTQLGFNITP